MMSAMGSRDGKENNFTLLRFVAAGLVIVSHGIELPTAVRSRDWAHQVTGFTLSWYAVGAFFIISGYLVLGSWDRQPSLLAFARNRFLRIWPGLLVMLLVTVPVLGLLFSTLPPQRFFTHLQTVGYFLGALSVVRVQYFLPGVFEANPLPAVNGSLWTLRFEVLCYAVLGILGAAGLARGKLRSILLATLLLALVVIGTIIGSSAFRGSTHGMLYELSRLGLCFALGAAFREFRDRIPLHVLGIAVLGCLAALATGTALYMPLACIALAYTVFWVAFVPDTPALRRVRDWPDYSYGLYIWAFPIQQVIVAYEPLRGQPAVIILLSFLMTLPFAALSWHMVEKPALRLKSSTAPRTMPMEAEHER